MVTDTHRKRGRLAGVPPAKIDPLVFTAFPTPRSFPSARAFSFSVQKLSSCAKIYTKIYGPGSFSRPCSPRRSLVNGPLRIVLDFSPGPRDFYALVTRAYFRAGSRCESSAENSRCAEGAGPGVRLLGKLRATATRARDV